MRGEEVRNALAAAPPVLVRQILGTTSASAVESALDRLPLAVASCFRLELSVGALFGLELENGTRVALKVHQPHVLAEDVTAIQAVQEHLVAHGFPCPRPVLGPVAFLERVAAVEEWRDEGEPVIVVDAAMRRTMAQLLAAHVSLLDGHPSAVRLSWLPRDDRLWPTPHNALFDFEATARGTEWIDEIAAAVRPLHRAGPMVLAHHDWSAKHFRASDGDVTVIYDWDSVFCDNESIALGAAAATHTAVLGAAEPWAPRVEDAVAFIAEYERFRPLADATRAAAHAHVVWSVAYTARCEHALETAGTVPRTAARRVLPGFAESFPTG